MPAACSKATTRSLISSIVVRSGSRSRKLYPEEASQTLDAVSGEGAHPEIKIQRCRDGTFITSSLDVLIALATCDSRGSDLQTDAMLGTHSGSLAPCPSFGAWQPQGPCCALRSSTRVHRQQDFMHKDDAQMLLTVSDYLK
eukprot:106649-Rhodomonas_salina.3